MEKIKLLIVDDEVNFLQSIAKRLEIRDFDVVKATNGAEAISAANSHKFDIALLDLKMPGMDGRQVLEILKKEHRYIEVIVLTGHGSLESAVECTKLGAFGYLPKPYEFDKLLEILKDAFSRRMQKKFENDNERIQKLMEIATGSSPLGILREMKDLDNREK